MTIGDRFTALLDARGIKQAALAAQYRERALMRGREFARDTIESHISRLKKGEPVAVRFFFADLTDARDLLDLLAVPEAEQGVYVRDANVFLSPEERPLRVVVDLSDSVQAKALVEVCDELAEKVIMAIPERLALVVTESQRGYLLPRCTPEGRVQVEVVADAEQGWARTLKLAADGAVVVSGRRFDPLARWIAIEYRNGHLVLEPAEGITRCAVGKPIEDEDADASPRRLDLLVEDVMPADPPREFMGSPIGRRMLLTSLMQGKPVRAPDGAYYDRRSGVVDAKTRLAWGKALGVPVVGTEMEWGELLAARARALGVTVSATGSAHDVTSHRAQVARGGHAPRAIVVDGKLHLINADAELRTRMQHLHGVQFHDEVRRESAFERIEKLVAATPWEAWLDDPYLDAAIERIDPDQKDRDELEFARASLLLHGKLSPSTALYSREWRATLSDMLRGEPPPVGLRVPTTCKTDYGIVTLLPSDEVARRASRRGAELHGVPAIVPPRVVRDSSLCMLRQEVPERYYRDDNRTAAWWKRCRFLLPREEGLANHDWLNSLLDGSPAKIGDSETNRGWERTSQAMYLSGLEWSTEAVPTPPLFWRAADEALAALWIALRRAVRHADATTLHDGTGMLEMGSGLVALIKATHLHTRGNEHLEADFLSESRRIWVERDGKRGMTWDYELPGARSIVQEIGTRVARTHNYETRIMAEVPTQLFLARGSARMTITFRATPWESFGERAMESEVSAAVAGVLHAENDADDD